MSNRKVDVKKTLKLNFNFLVVCVPSICASYLAEGAYKLTCQNSKAEKTREWRERLSNIQLGDLAFMSVSDVYHARRPDVDNSKNYGVKTAYWYLNE